MTDAAGKADERITDETNNDSSPAWKPFPVRAGSHHGRREPSLAQPAPLARAPRSRELSRENCRWVERPGGESANIPERLAPATVPRLLAVYGMFGSKERILGALGARGMDILAGSVFGNLPMTDDPRQDVVEAALVFRRFALEHPALFSIAFHRVDPAVWPGFPPSSDALASSSNSSKRSAPKACSEGVAFPEASLPVRRTHRGPRGSRATWHLARGRPRNDVHAFPYARSSSASPTRLPTRRLVFAERHISLGGVEQIAELEGGYPEGQSRRLISDGLAPRSPWSRGVALGALIRRRPPAQAVLLGKARNALAIHLEPMLCGDCAELDRIRGAGGSFEEVDHLLEVPFEPRGRDHFEDASRLVACVPERMPLTPRLEDQVARLAVDDLVPEKRIEPALDNEAVLHHAAVPVERRWHGHVAESDVPPSENPPPVSSPASMNRAPIDPSSPARRSLEGRTRALLESI